MKAILSLLFLAFLPLAGNATAELGAGAAGFGTGAVMTELGAAWFYNWTPECWGRPRCLPMLRTWDNGTPNALVADAMATCYRPCKGILLLNEPGQQDVCDAGCQAELLHAIAPQVHAINPEAVVVFGNYVQADMAFVHAVKNAWVQRWGYTFGEFMRANNVAIGIHHYAWAGYTRDTWRSQLTFVRDEVARLWGAPVVVSEWGSLADAGLWRQVVADQKQWLAEQAISSALFNANVDPRWGSFDMLVDGEMLSEYGQWYVEH